jgi:hypothetical protein
MVRIELENASESARCIASALHVEPRLSEHNESSEVIDVRAQQANGAPQCI